MASNNHFDTLFTIKHYLPFALSQETMLTVVESGDGTSPRRSIGEDSAPQISDQVNIQKKIMKKVNNALVMILLIIMKTIKSAS